MSLLRIDGEFGEEEHELPFIKSCRQKDEAADQEAERERDEHSIKNYLLWPRLSLTLCPNIINKRVREKHLEPMRPSRPFFSKRKS